MINNLFIRVKQLSKDYCPGCQSNYRSILLHHHEEESMLDKLIKYLDIARGELTILQLEILFKRFSRIEKEVIPNKCEWVKEVCSIIMLGTPYSLYYGRYITTELDNAMKSLMYSRKRSKKIADPAKTDLEQLLLDCYDNVSFNCD